jgi:hypothetical protein
MTAVLSESGCADEESNPPFPPFSEKAANPVVAVPSVWERDTAGVGSLNAASGG